MKTKRPAKKIDFHANLKDFECVYYAGIGLDWKTIMELTGYTKGQVNKRLKKAGIGVRSYRHAATPVATYVIKNTRGVVEKHIMRLL